MTDANFNAKIGVEGTQESLSQLQSFAAGWRTLLSDIGQNFKAGFIEGFEKAEKKADDFTKNTTKSFGRDIPVAFNASTGALASFGTGLTGITLGAAALGYELRKSIVELADYDRLVRQATNSLGLNRQQTNDLKQTAHELALSLAMDEKEIIAGIDDLAQRLGDKEKAFQIFPKAAEYARNAGVPIHTAIMLITEDMADFGVKTENITRVLDVHLKTLGQLAPEYERFQARVGPTMLARGLGGEENLAQLQAMYKITSQAQGGGQRAGTRTGAAMGGLIEQVLNPNTTLGRAMGPQIQEIQARGGGIGEILQAATQFLQQQGGLRQDAVGGRVLERFLPGASPEQVGVLRSMVKEQEQLTKIYKEQRDAIGENERQTKTWADSVGVRVKTVTQSWTDLWRSISGAAIGIGNPPSVGEGFSNLWNTWRPRRRMQHGGIVGEHGPEEIIAGEAGPEAVIPLGRGGGGSSSDLKANTRATEDNTEALNRLTRTMWPIAETAERASFGGGGGGLGGRAVSGIASLFRGGTGGWGTGQTSSGSGAPSQFRGGGGSSGGGGASSSWGGGGGRGSGDVTPIGGPTPGDMVDDALRLEGLHEQGDRDTIKQYLATGGVGMDPATTKWCAGFVNASLARHGIQGTGDQRAASFYNWGQAVTGDVQKGDIMVRPSSAGTGHVGIATGLTKPGYAQMISGNSSDRIQRTWERIGSFQARRATPQMLAEAQQRVAGRQQTQTAGGNVTAALAEPDAPTVDNPLHRIGISQNNPYNIKFTGKGWQSDFPGIGPGTTFDQGDRQAAFNSPQAGLNAGAYLALRKFGQGMRTVESIIGSKLGWTPGHQQAINSIAGMMGLDRKAQLNLYDADQLTSFLDSLGIQEQGRRYYPKSMVAAAARKAIAAVRGGGVRAANAAEGGGSIWDKPGITYKPQSIWDKPGITYGTGTAGLADTTPGHDVTSGISYQEGTPYVPQTGTYTLHEGEAVIPSLLNTAKNFWRGGALGVAQGEGYEPPGWLKTSADFARSAATEYGLGLAHGGMPTPGAPGLISHGAHMAVDAASAVLSRRKEVEQLWELFSLRQMLEKPIRMSVEAPTNIPQFAARRQVGRRAFAQMTDRALDGFAREANSDSWFT